MLIGINHGPNLTENSSELFLNDVAESGDLRFSKTTMKCTKAGTLTATIPVGNTFEFMFVGGNFAIELGEEGDDAWTHFPVIARYGGAIRFRAQIDESGVEHAKFVMPDKSITLGYRVRLVEAVGNKVDNVLAFSGIKEELGPVDVANGQTLIFGHDMAKLSPEAVVEGKIILIVPGSDTSSRPKWGSVAGS